MQALPAIDSLSVPCTPFQQREPGSRRPIWYDLHDLPGCHLVRGSVARGPAGRGRDGAQSSSRIRNSSSRTSTTASPRWPIAWSCGTLSQRRLMDQVLDQMDLERRRASRSRPRPCACAAVEDLLDRDLVRPAALGAVTFRHILIREVASAPCRAERLGLHGAAGRWLITVTAASAGPTSWRSSLPFTSGRRSRSGASSARWRRTTCRASRWSGFDEPPRQQQPDRRRSRLLATSTPPSTSRRTPFSPRCTSDWGRSGAAVTRGRGLRAGVGARPRAGAWIRP